MDVTPTRPTGTLLPPDVTPTADPRPAPDPTEVPTNLGIIITAGVLFVIGFVLFLQDQRKRARAVAAGKMGYGNFSGLPR